MTLIISGVAQDGIVLSSDRCESTEASNKFVNKIYSLKSGSLFSFAGDLGVAQKIMDGINSLDISDDPFLSQVETIENVTRSMNKRYRKNGDVSAHFFLTMVDDAGKPLVQYFDDDGTSLRIDSYDTIGNGSLMAAYFLKTLYKPDMKCDELAAVFSFVITLISQSEINSSVKVSREFPPEFYIINNLNARKPYLYQNEFLWEVNRDKIRVVNNCIVDLFNSEKTRLYVEQMRRYW